MAPVAPCEIDRHSWRDTLRLCAPPRQQRFIAGYAPVTLVALARACVRLRCW